MDHWRNQRGNKKIPRDKWKQKHNNPKAIGCSKSSSKSEVYSNMVLLQETKIPNKEPNLTPKAIEKEQQNPKLVEGSKSKIRAEINWNRD